MKHRIASAALILCVLSCSPHGGARGTALYTDSTQGFRLRYPQTWKVLGPGDTPLVMFSGGGTNRQITVSTETGGEAQIAEKLKQFDAFFPGHRVLEAGWTTVNGRRAYLQTARWNSPLGDYKAYRLFVVAGDRFFLVSALTPANEFDHYARVLRACVLSFEVTGKQGGPRGE